MKKPTMKTLPKGAKPKRQGRGGGAARKPVVHRGGKKKY